MSEEQQDDFEYRGLTATAEFSKMLGAFRPTPQLPDGKSVVSTLTLHGVDLDVPRLLEVCEQHTEMLAMLDRIRFGGKGSIDNYCPICGYVSSHADGCELAALLKRVRGEA